MVLGNQTDQTKITALNSFSNKFIQTNPTSKSKTYNIHSSTIQFKTLTNNYQSSTENRKKKRGFYQMREEEKKVESDAETEGGRHCRPVN